MNNGFFVFECPFCGQKLECDESWENQKTQCPTCGKEIVPTKNAEIPASDKSKLSLEKRNVILGISGGFLAGFLISFAVFYLIFGFGKKEKTSEQKKPVKIVKSGNTFTQKTEVKSKAVKNVFVPVQKKTAIPLSRPVQKTIISDADRQDMLQIKIFTPDWSNPTSDMLDGMVENDLIKPWILPMVDGMQKYYPPKWDMSLLKKAGKCVFEKAIMRNYYKSDEQGQWYIAGKITPKIAKISLVFKVDKWEDQYEFVIYASEKNAHVENAKSFYLAVLKFNDFSSRFKSGSKKGKQEDIRMHRGGEYSFGAINLKYNTRRDNVYPFCLDFYGYSGRKEKNELLSVKMSGEEFSRMSLVMLYAFDKLANHHLKRHYWVRNKQAGQKNNNVAK